MGILDMDFIIGEPENGQVTVVFELPAGGTFTRSVNAVYEGDEYDYDATVERVQSLVPGMSVAVVTQAILSDQEQVNLAAPQEE